ncbi:MAG: polysaccharide deacetylase family protein, partial [Caldimonas sp.]
VAEVAPVPMTFLAVPRFHHDRATRALEDWLGGRRREGDEIALHGYTHLDEGTPRNPIDRLRRTVYTRGEGEFWDLSPVEAAERLALGIAWFRRNGWPVRGFVAPAWLIGPGAWQALLASPFDYTSTLREIRLLGNGRCITSQSIVYSTGSAWRRASSVTWAAAVAAAQSRNPVLRIELHPRDADHAGVRRSWQRLLEREMRRREALTVAQLCDRWVDKSVRPLQATN